MKWNNKDHQFDELGRYLAGINTIFIWGASQYGTELFNRLVWLGIENDFEIIFVDSFKNGSTHCKKPVISPCEFFSMFCDNGKMVLLIASFSLREIYIENNFSNNCEIVMGKNSFANYSMHEPILRNFFSILMMYKYGKLFSVFNDVISTTICTLNCQGCLNYTTLNNSPRHHSIEILKNDVDLLFEKADYVNMINISGGEPNLHPDIYDLIEHIGKYRDRIYEFLFITNGTVMPNGKILTALAKHRSIVRVDDYRETVLLARETVPRALELLKKYNISHYLMKTDNWIDTKPQKTTNHFMSENMLINYYDLCGNPYKYVKDGKLYSCNYHGFAVEAGICEEMKCDYLDIAHASKMEVFEFLLGCSQKGYCTFCKQCDGFFTVNKNKIVPAVQMGRS